MGENLAFRGHNKVVRIMNDAPVRLCCGERHWGPQCKDGLVMCQLCFDRFSTDKLHVVDGIPEDVCQDCAEKEEAHENPSLR